MTRAEENTKPTLDEKYIGVTELGDGDRLVAWYGDQFRYVPQWKQFLLWDDTRWAADDTMGINRLVQQVPRRMFREASELGNNADVERAIKNALKCMSVAKMAAMLTVAKANAKIAIKPDVLDADPWLLNVRNGTIDLRTGKLQKHDQANMITKRIEIDYNPNAKCPTWDKFINTVTGGDKELAHYLQKASGYSLSGVISAQCLFFIWGTGANGKSVFVETLFFILGEYGVRTPTETLMAKDRQGGVSNDLARLAGKRFVAANETNEGARLDESKIKSLTSEDTISARYLYGEFFEFAPTHKLWIVGNHKPLVKGSDAGIWRRIKLVPFTVTINPEDRDPNLMLKLQREAPGILNWMLKGNLDWQAEGLEEPPSVQAATSDYRNDMDVMSAFIEECCDIDSAAEMTSQEAYRAFCDWSLKEGEREISHKSFGLRLKDLGFHQKRTDSKRLWEGISLKSKAMTHFEKREEIPF